MITVFMKCPKLFQLKVVKQKFLLKGVKHKHKKASCVSFDVTTKFGILVIQRMKNVELSLFASSKDTSSSLRTS